MMHHKIKLIPIGLMLVICASPFISKTKHKVKAKPKHQKKYTKKQIESLERLYYFDEWVGV